MSRTSKAEMERRYARTEELMLERGRSINSVRYVALEFGVSMRQARKYFQEVEERLKRRERDDEWDDRRTFALALIRETKHRAFRAGNYRDTLRAAELEARIEGFTDGDTHNHLHINGTPTEAAQPETTSTRLQALEADAPAAEIADAARAELADLAALLADESDAEEPAVIDAEATRLRLVAEGGG